MGAGPTPPDPPAATESRRPPCATAAMRLLSGRMHATQPQQIFERMARSLAEGDSEAAAAAAGDSVRSGLDPLEAAEAGFGAAIRALGEAFEREELSLARLLAGSEAAQAGLAVLEAAMRFRFVAQRAAPQGPRPQHAGPRPSGPAVAIGTVAGDVHDIGKTLVAAVLRAGGYRVRDLGAEVPAARFVAAAGRAQVLAMSAMLSTSMIHQRDAVRLLAEQHPDRRCLTLVGGAPVTQSWADEIGADAYAPGAREAAALLDRLLGQAHD